jgi:hypothetical protein
VGISCAICSLCKLASEFDCEGEPFSQVFPQLLLISVVQRSLPTDIKAGKDSSFPALDHLLDFYRSERTRRSDSFWEGEGDRRLARFVCLVGIRGKADLRFRNYRTRSLRRLGQFD